MSWLAKDEVHPEVPRVQCDCCGTMRPSRYDLRLALPHGWAATKVRGRHACGRCASKLGLRLAR